MGSRDTLLKTMSLTRDAGGNINLTVSRNRTLSLRLIYDAWVPQRAVVCLRVTAEHIDMM